MPLIEISLLAKTFIILLSMVAISWIGDRLGRLFLIDSYNRERHFIRKNDHDTSFLIDTRWLKAVGFLSLVPLLVVLIGLVFAAKAQSPYVLPLLTAFSLYWGFILRLEVHNVDKSLVRNALLLTVVTICVTGLVASIPGINFSSLAPYLAVATLAYGTSRFVMLFIAFSKQTHKRVAQLGVIVFSVLLLYDINRLVITDKITDQNTWQNAITFAVLLYLEIMNLFVNFLEYLLNI